MAEILTAPVKTQTLPNQNLPPVFETGALPVIAEEQSSKIPFNPSRFQGEAGRASLEVLGTAVDYTKLAVIGLARAINARRLDNVEESSDKLKRSLDIYQEAPAAHGVGRELAKELKPETRLQKRQSARALRRQARAISRQSRLKHRHIALHGENGDHTPKQRRQAKKEHHGLFWNISLMRKWNEGYVNRKFRRVNRSAAGRDIPGNYLRSSLKSENARERRLFSQHIRLLGQEKSIRKDIQDRKEDRRIIKRDRRQKREELRDKPKENAEFTPYQATWQKDNRKIAVRVIGIAQRRGGRSYVYVEGSSTPIPIDEVTRSAGDRFGERQAARRQPMPGVFVQKDNEDIPDAEIVEDE